MKKNQSPEMIALEAQRRALAARRKPSRKKPPARCIKISPSQHLGFVKEDQALSFLKQQGLEILEKNVHSRFGEIDIVARSEQTLVIIEVRFRASSSHGGAGASVCLRKQQRIKQSALFFLPSWSQRYFEGKTPFCRFDVIAFEGDSLVWIHDAFR